MLSGLAVSLVLALSAPLAQAETTDSGSSELSNEDFVEMFDNADLPNLEPFDPPPTITGSITTDRRVRTIAERRGYQIRSGPIESLTLIDGHLLQPDAAAAWADLKGAARAAGIGISLTSGYRTPDSQTWLMQRQLSGWSEDELNAVLDITAPPGYSKHHTGYAIDLRSGSATLYDFADTAAYRWLAEDSFANARAHGWVPSYPDGVDNVGPLPEPWEFVWVGTDTIFCHTATTGAAGPFCDDERPLTTCASPVLCPRDSVTRSHFAWPEAPTVLPLR